MLKNETDYLLNSLNDLENDIRENDELYSDMRMKIEKRLNDLKDFASEKNIPFIVDLDSLINRNLKKEYVNIETESSVYETETETEDSSFY
jgi:hypothetical protein